MMSLQSSKRRVTLRAAILAVLASLALLLSQGAPAAAQETAGICGRTQKVQDAILAKLPGVTACGDVTASDLAGITGALTISDMGVTSLQSGDFAGLSGLTTMKLTDTRISALPEDVFDGLTGLERLELTFNELTALPEDVFGGLGNLRVLYLYQNKITALPEDLFDGLTSLKSLNLLHNDIADLPEDLFDGLTGLEQLAIKGNELSTLPEEVFDGLSKLELLFLDDNQITALPEGVFDGLGNLQWLFLNKNEIAGLPADVFDGPGNLLALALYDNQISALPDGVFDGLGNLRTLYLSFNQMSDLPPGAFEGIDGLAHLDMTHNPGSPFTFAAELEQKDGGFVVKVAQGAPFHMSVRLSADGGTLSTDTATVAAGSLESEVVTATASEPDQPQVTVNVESVKFLGSAEWAADLAWHLGIEASPGASLTLPVATTDRATAANHPATGAPAITGTPLAGQTLTADTSGIEDEDGLTGVSFSYRWLFSDGDTDTEIEDATASTYTLTADDQGKAIKVRVAFTDDAGNEETLTSLAVVGTVVPAPNAPAEGLPAISGTARVGETLTADTSGITDEDGLEDAVFSHQWIASDGSADADIQDATGSTYTLAVDDEGKTIKVKATFTDDGGNEETLTSAATAAVEPAPNSPATGQPDISGVAQVGETLTADVSGIDDADGLDDAVFSYQWIRNDGTTDTDIQDARDSTYVLDADDEATTIKVRVSFTDDRGHGEALTSAATSAVAGPPPEPLTASLESTPEAHDGEASFTFELRFSEEFKLSYKTLRDHAFTVAGGSVKKARRLAKGSNIGWRITVRPDSNGDVTIALPATGDCGDTGAICTEDGRPLSNRLELTISGPGG